MCLSPIGLVRQMPRRIQPNAEEKRWLSSVVELAQEKGCIATGNFPFEIHHVLGRTARHNKVDVGHWFIIPVWFDLHHIDTGNPDNVTHYPKRFTAKYGLQTALFAQMVETLENRGYKIPPAEVLEAIADTGK